MGRANDQPFDRGQTYYGPDASIDTNNLLGAQLPGIEKVFEDYDYSSTQLTAGVAPRRSERKVTCRLMRNTSGITILPKRLCYVNAAGTEITGVSNSSGQRCVVVDEFLPSAGVRNGDICWVVIEGPAMCITPFAGSGFGGDIAAGNPLQALTSSAGSTSGASTATNGRPQLFTTVAATTAGQFTDLINYLQNYIGTAISARTTGETNSDILVDIRKTPG